MIVSGHKPTIDSIFYCSCALDDADFSSSCFVSAIGEVRQSEGGSLYVLFLILNLGEEERSTDYGHFEAYTPGKPSIKAARRKEIHEGV